MQDLSNDQKIKFLRELAAIFRDLKKHADQGTYKDDETGARKLIIEGLDKGAQAVPLMDELRIPYRLRNVDPENEYASAYTAFTDLGERLAGEPKEEIEHHVKLFVEELTGQRPWGYIPDYIALANELDRWTDKLAKGKVDKGAIQTEIPQDQYSKKLTPKAANVYEVLKSLPPERGMTGREILDVLSKKSIFLDQSTLTKSIMPILKEHYHVKNKRGVGYFIAQK